MLHVLAFRPAEEPSLIPTTVEGIESCPSSFWPQLLITQVHAGMLGPLMTHCTERSSCSKLQDGGAAGATAQKLHTKFKCRSFLSLHINYAVLLLQLVLFSPELRFASSNPFKILSQARYCLPEQTQLPIPLDSCKLDASRISHHLSLSPQASESRFTSRNNSFQTCIRQATSSPPSSSLPPHSPWLHHTDA